MTAGPRPPCAEWPWLLDHTVQDGLLFTTGLISPWKARVGTRDTFPPLGQTFALRPGVSTGVTGSFLAPSRVAGPVRIVPYRAEVCLRGQLPETRVRLGRTGNVGH